MPDPDQPHEKSPDDEMPGAGDDAPVAMPHPMGGKWVIGKPPDNPADEDAWIDAFLDALGAPRDDDGEEDEEGRDEGREPTKEDTPNGGAS
jgi:hypothetical protein